MYQKKLLLLGIKFCIKLMDEIEVDKNGTKEIELHQSKVYRMGKEGFHSQDDEG